MLFFLFILQLSIFLTQGESELDTNFHELLQDVVGGLVPDNSEHREIFNKLETDI
jgi:hypothetical protein